MPRDDSLTVIKPIIDIRGNLIPAVVSSRGVNEWAWLWGPIVLILWVVSVAVIVWLVARTTKSKSDMSLQQARKILTSRYKRGELTEEEYRRWMDWLS
jgi:uncharacterized membrane protein